MAIHVCPRCRTTREPGYHLCPVCGYNFTLDQRAQQPPDIRTVQSKTENTSNLSWIEEALTDIKILFIIRIIHPRRRLPLSHERKEQIAQFDTLRHIDINTSEPTERPHTFSPQVDHTRAAIALSILLVASILSVVLLTLVVIKLYFGH